MNVLYEAPNGELSMAPASHVMEQLETVLCDAREPSLFPVGILTSEHRDTWTVMRERLARGEKRGTDSEGNGYMTTYVYTSSDPVNSSSLHDIETSMFTLCLDKSHPHVTTSISINDPQAEVLAKRVLHGNGTEQNSCNRWFDSAVQVSTQYRQTSCTIVVFEYRSVILCR